MALTATFAADFEKFEASLKGAAFQLQAFDRATARSMQTLKKETEGFSGQKIAIEAARMAEAVTRLGGAGGSAAGLLKLLPDELKRVSAALDTAAEKAKLLGETFPPSLQKVRDEIGKLSKATTELPKATTAAANGFASMATAFKGFLALGITTQIASMARSVVNAVDEFDELAGRISDTTDNIQKLKAVSQSYDVSLDALVNGVQELQKRLGDPSDEFIKSLGQLNLTVGELKALAPTDAIVAMLEALGRIPNAADRAAAANVTLGRSQKELAGAMKEGVEQTDAWIKMTPQTIKFVDSLKEGTSRLTSAMLALTAELAANVSGWNAWQTVVEHGRTALNAMVLDAENFKRVMSKQVGDLPDVKSLGVPTSWKPPIDPNDEKAMAAIEKSLTKSAERAIDFNREMQQAAKEMQKAKDEATVWGGGIEEAAHWMEVLAEESQHLELPKTVEFAKIFEMGPDVWLDEFQQWLDSRTEAVRQWSGMNSKKITEIFEFGPDPQIGALTQTFEKAAKTIKGTFATAFKDLPQVIMKALQGGGDVGKSIGAMFGSSIFGEGSDLVKKASGGLTKGLGKLVGGAVGSIIPGLGTIVGAFAGEGIQKLMGKIFGGEGKQVNKLRDQFTAAAGGIDKLAQHAMEAGKSMDAFFAADTVKEYEAAIKDLDGAFKALERNRAAAGSIFDDLIELGENGIPDFLQPHINQLIELGLLTEEQAEQLRDLAGAGATNWKKIEDAAAKYGVRIESLGQPFNAQRIGADAAGIINAFTAIVNAGGDVGGVLFDMQDEISKLVQDSQKFGTTIPANMKPWIEELSRAGLLVDANGELIKDMGGIQFGDAIETEAEKTRKAFESITEAIRELIRTMNSIPSFGGGGGGGGTSYSPTEPNPAVYASNGGGGGGGSNSYTVNMQVDGRTVADAVIDQMGNRLSVRGAR